jgi:hypothetical protein
MQTLSLAAPPTPFDIAVDHGLTWLERRASATPSVAWFADVPDQRFALSALRTSVRARHGLDLGFDAGPELFSAMVAARTLACVRRGRSCAGMLGRTFAAHHWQRRFRFFAEQNGFAADTDCTGVALAALFDAGLLERHELHAGARQLLDAAAPGDGDLEPGVVLVYWEDGLEPHVAPRGRKQDPAVATNALYAVLLAAQQGLDDRRIEGFIAANLAYVRRALTQPHELRTRYYPSRDALLWFVAELCGRFSTARAALGRPLRDAMLARLDREDTRGDNLELAMRLGAAITLGIRLPRLAEALAARQLASGVLASGAFFTLGRVPGLCFGSDMLTTALAVTSLERWAGR